MLTLSIFPMQHLIDLLQKYKFQTNTGVATYNGHTNKVLVAKHPYITPPSMLATLFYEARIVVEVDIVFMFIKLF